MGKGFKRKDRLRNHLIATPATKVKRGVATCHGLSPDEVEKMVDQVVNVAAGSLTETANKHEAATGTTTDLDQDSMIWDFDDTWEEEDYLVVLDK